MTLDHVVCVMPCISIEFVLGGEVKWRWVTWDIDEILNGEIWWWGRGRVWKEKVFSMF